MRHRFPAFLMALAVLASLNGFSNLQAQDASGQPGGVGCDGWYFGLGAQGLRRSGLAHAPVGLIDPGAQTTTRGTALFLVNGQDGNAATEPGEQFPFNALISGTANTTRTTFVDTGARPAVTSPSFGDLGLTHQAIDLGFRGTIGYGNGDAAVELTGFFVKKTQKSLSYTGEQFPAGPSPMIQLVAIDNNALNRVFDFDGPDPGRTGDAEINSVGASPAQAGTPSSNRLDLAFFNAPAGFNGNNGLWLQADKVTLTYQNSLGNIEFNYRAAGLGSSIEGISLHYLAGLRYCDAKEQFAIITQDDPVATPTTVAAYTVQTNNHVIAPQLGLVVRDMVVPPVVAFTAFAKAAWGVNLVDRNVTLQRADGLVGFNGTAHDQDFAQVYELGVTAEFTFNQTVHLSGGYNAMWLLGVAEASQQIDFNLAHTTGTGRNNGHMFYQGPSFELGIYF